MSRTLFTFLRMIYDKRVVVDYYNEVGLTLVPEFTFSDEHGYRFDFFHPPSGVAIEVQGGIWLPRGGHNTGAGLLRDMAKENLALSLGYRVFKCVPTDLCMDDTRDMFRRIVEVALNEGAINGGHVIAARSSVPGRRSDINDGEKPKRRSAAGRPRTKSNRTELSQ